MNKVVEFITRIRSKKSIVIHGSGNWYSNKLCHQSLAINSVTRVRLIKRYRFLLSYTVVLLWRAYKMSLIC